MTIEGEEGKSECEEKERKGIKEWEKGEEGKGRRRRNEAITRMERGLTKKKKKKKKKESSEMERKREE